VEIKLPTIDSFNVSATTFCGVNSYLITPKIDAKWNTHNLFYRSLIVDEKGKVLSSGFPKFFNYGEKQECYPDPKSFNDWRHEEKIDGSLLIADFVNNTFSMRTRGTVSYVSQENAKDFENLPDKYPKVVDFLKDNQHLTLLFEIVTPNNVIVVRSQQVNFYLIGAINKNEMRVVSSSELTDIWRNIGQMPVPQSYDFLNTNELSKIAETIKYWKGKEGIVVTYNNGQNRIKLKSDWYCFIHKVKSQLNSIKNIVEFFVEKEQPKAEEFTKIIEVEFDYEIAIQLQKEIQKICEASNKVKKYVMNMAEMITDIRNVETRKEQAEMIKRTYKENASYAFNLLDNKPFTKEQHIKLLMQHL
jgi:hypothetical protein